MVARLGGDEFAILMPETNESAARPAVERVIAAVDTSLRSAVPAVEGLGATAGVVVFKCVPRSADHVIGLADELMYGGKHEGRGTVLLEVYAEE